MADVTIFHQAFCPYCRMAKKALEALKAEHPAYAGIRVRWIDENLQRGLADQYDYWYVPSVYLGTRKRAGHVSSVFTLADLTVDTASHTVRRGEKLISLSAKEFALLEYMIRNKGVVLSREQIENNLWNYDYSGGSNVVDVYISYLRRKIDSGFPRKLIHTVWGTGWVLREEE